MVQAQPGSSVQAQRVQALQAPVRARSRW